MSPEGAPYHEAKCAAPGSAKQTLSCRTVLHARAPGPLKHGLAETKVIDLLNAATEIWDVIVVQFAQPTM